MGLISEFREFAMRGNVVDMAVGVIIGGAFGRIITVMVEKIMMPPIGMLTRGVDISDRKFVMKDAVVDAAGKVTTPEVAIGYGEFINVVIAFLIVAFCLFIVIKAMNTAKARFDRAKPAPAPAGPTKEEVLLTEIRDLLAARR